jgi:hypothetical protein
MFTKMKFVFLLPSCLVLLALLRRRPNIRPTARRRLSFGTKCQPAPMKATALLRHRLKARAQPLHTSIQIRQHSKHSHIAHRYSSVRRSRNGCCRESSGSPFSVRRQMYRCKLFLQPPLPQCRSTPSELKKFLGPRARPKHKSSLRQKRSLMSPRTGFIMQISW